MEVSSDFKDLLQALNDANAKYLVVGGMALAFHSRPRFTRDLDIWVEASPTNAQKVYSALANFGAPLDNLSQNELEHPDLVFQIGIEPVRVDILTSITGVNFDEAWKGREKGTYSTTPVFIIGRDQLIKNKRATGRLQDLADIEQLER
jgi:Nucleotidyl transferase of unknown function (DUF2204)